MHRNAATSIDLSGEWRFFLDPIQVGIEQQLYRTMLPDTVILPSTTEENRKGTFNPEAATWGLSREYPFTGFAWYQREIIIPTEQSGKQVRLLLERTKNCSVWLDERFIGSKNALCTAHVYELGRDLAPDSYRLTVLVDNANLPPLGGTQQLSEHTQTNWNGIIGRIELQFVDPLHIADVQVSPDITQKKLTIHATLRNTTDEVFEGSLTLSALSDNTSHVHAAEARSYPVKLTTGDTEIAIDYALGEGAQLWDEEIPACYRLTLRLVVVGGGVHYADEGEVGIGLRKFSTHDGQFTINGQPVFLRGKLDNCVFPLTGYPPASVEDWMKVYRTAKEYGLNHYRFHSWCPPEAAFMAADLTGMYLQVELPVWALLHEPDHSDYHPEQEAFLREEGVRILKEYGNYPSFVMLALGNELGGSPAILADMVKQLKQTDRGRRLYAQGSNNFFWQPVLAEGDDFWVTMRTHGPGHMVRGSFSHCDLPLGHIQTEMPSTLMNYERSVADVPVPVVGHEVGQFQVYPNYAEIVKYTGVLKPRNLEQFRKRLEEQGMLDLAERFFQASGQLAVINYREEIEAALRTPRYGGFQLLDLQDFPGQGTALVGILDAFLESKGLIEPEAWREFCSNTVLLIRMAQYTYWNTEKLAFDVDVAHYGKRNLQNSMLRWTLSDGRTGHVIESGQAKAGDIQIGLSNRIASVELLLFGVKKASELVIEVALHGTEIRNHYRIWVYPPLPSIPSLGDVSLCRDVSEAGALLAQGKIVLLMPEPDRLANAVDGFFTSDFWSYSTFANIAKKMNVKPAPGTLGLMCRPEHPAMQGFPTETHSNYQWWSIVSRSASLPLDFTPSDYEPIVQVIDNVDRNNKLGLLFEMNVDNGKLLVCGADLFAHPERPEGRHLLHSLVAYMNSPVFRPSYRMDLARLVELMKFRQPIQEANPSGIITSEEVPDSANILDFVNQQVKP